MVCIRLFPHSAFLIGFEMKSYLVLLFVFIVSSSVAFRLSSEQNLRQDEGEENESGGATAEAGAATTNPPHLIGTLAGVLSSILRSGPNGTSPIKFNLTETLQRLTRFQIKLPSFPTLPTLPGFSAKQKVAPLGNKTLQKVTKIGKKKLNYRNPGTSTNQGINLLNEVEPIKMPVQSLQEDDYDDGAPTTKKTSPASKQPRPPYAAPSEFPIYPVATTTENPEEVAPSLETNQENKNGGSATTEVPVYPSVPIYSTESSFDLPKFDIGGMAGWLSIYLNPALKLAKDATRNITVNSVVNGTAEGVLTGVEGVKKGVQSVATSIPKLTEVITGLIDFFEDIE